MPTGTVTRLFEQRGFGYITPDESDRDVFFNLDQWPGDSRDIKEGQRLTYMEEDSAPGVRAVSVTLLA